MPTVGKTMARLRRTLTLRLMIDRYLARNAMHPPPPAAPMRALLCYWSFECLSRRYEELKVETVSLTALKHVRADPTLKKSS